MVNHKKIIAVIIGALFLSCLGSLIYLDYHYAYTRPKHPEPELGRIFPLDVHGTVVFLTKQENFQLQWLWYALAAFFLIAAIYVYYYDPFDQDKKEFRH